jgi:hypothetical protein
LRSLERHALAGCLITASLGKATASGVVSLWTLPDLLFFTPLMFTMRTSTPNAMLFTIVLAKLPIRRAGDNALHRGVRQRYAAGIGTDEHRDVRVLHMG